MRLAPGDARFEERLLRRLEDPSKRIKVSAQRAFQELRTARKRQPQAVGAPLLKATTLSGKSVEVRVLPSYSVSSAKELLAQEIGCHPSMLRLVMPCGALLDDRQLLDSVGFDSKWELTAILSSMAAESRDLELQLHLQNLNDSAEEVQLAALDGIALFIEAGQGEQVRRAEAAGSGIQACLAAAFVSEHWSIQAKSKRVALKAAKVLGALDPEVVVDLVLRAVRRQRRRIEGLSDAFERHPVAQPSRHWQSILTNELTSEKQWFLQLLAVVVPLAQDFQLDNGTFPLLPSVIRELPEMLAACVCHGSDRTRRDAATLASELRADSLQLLGTLEAPTQGLLDAMLQRLGQEKRQEILLPLVHCLSHFPADQDQDRISKALVGFVGSVRKRELDGARQLAADILCSHGLEDALVGSLGADVAAAPGSCNAIGAEAARPRTPDSWDAGAVPDSWD